MNNLIYNKKYTYTVSNRNCYDDFASWSILDLFQDVASEHIENYHYGFEEMYAKGLIWVLVRTKYQVIKDATPLDKELLMTTWQSEQARADFTRDYIISSISGETYIKGSSKWCLLDLNTRRIAPTSALGVDITNPKKLFEEPFKKLTFESLYDKETVLEQKVLKTKLDHNGHLNNAKYLEIITDAINLEKEEKIETLEINYNKEAFFEDIISVKCERIDKEVFVEGYRGEELIFKCKITIK